MSGFEPLVAGAAVSAVNSAVKAATGKSIARNCYSAFKGFRKRVLQKAGEKAGEKLSKEAEEVLFNQEERAEFERRLGSHENLLESVASNPAADDPSVIQELVGLQEFLEGATPRYAEERAGVLTAIDQRINTLHLALNNATSRDSRHILEAISKMMSEASIRDKIQDQVDAEATVAKGYAFVSPKKKALIGSGSFARTWKMKNKEDKRIYAVKHTDILSAQTKGVTMENLREEAARLQMLNHQNIVRYYEAFKYEASDGLDYFAIVMELLNGGSLHERLKRERGLPMSSARAVSTAKWARQVASALAHMHTRRMQHRDLKPDNVVFDEYGDARVIDLGLAVVVKAKAAVSSAGGANKVGAEAYRSPEKADGKRYDGKDDVWALGCMLGGAVTGTLAEDRCSGRALTRTAAKALVDEAAASEKFGDLVKKMLERNPNARPTAQAIERSLLRGELLPTSSGCATIVEEEEAIAPAKPSNWTCSVCKRPNGAQTQECGVCGTRKDYQKRQRNTEPVKHVTGKSIASHCRSAAKGLRNIVLSKAGAQIDLSKLALVRTLRGHSETVRCGVHRTFVMICLRRRSRALRCFRTGGALCLRRATTRSRCGTWRPANAWRRWKGTRDTCVAASTVLL